MLGAATSETVGQANAAAAPRINSTHYLKTIGDIAKEGPMKRTARKSISALLMTSILAGCGMIPAQNQNAISGGTNAQPSVSAGWNKITEMERESVRRGELPP